MSVLTQPIHQALEFLYNLTGNYGWTIVLLTLVVRFSLTPLYIWQQRSMKKSAAVQAEIKAIQEQYQGEEQQRKLAEVYGRSGGAMLAGFLPSLAQLPVFMAMYGALHSFAYVMPAGFFWLENLAAPDPYFILPLLALATSIWQVWSSTPKAQRITMLIVPVIFSLLLIKTSAAVMIYWVAGNLVSVVQQYLFARRPLTA